MFLIKAKLATGLILVATVVALFGGAFSSVGGIAQDAPKGKDVKARIVLGVKKDASDEDFIRRVSKDLRGVEPSPTEVHFFATSKEPGKREKLVDLFIKEREAKKKHSGAGIELRLDGLVLEGVMEKGVLLTFEVAPPPRHAGLQKEFFKELSGAKGKDDVGRITSSYLDRLVKYINANPKNDDVRDATRQVITIYESQGKSVEAKAWRDRIEKAK